MAPRGLPCGPTPRPSAPVLGRLSGVLPLSRITFFIPGMFCQDGVRGHYPAVSITGSRCDLGCDHCRGKLLASMVPAEDSEGLVARCVEIEAWGGSGVLISGGADRDGKLPWAEFLPGVREVRRGTRLKLSAHTGFVTRDEARALAEAGIDQGLFDVIGSDETLREVCHLDRTVGDVAAVLDHLLDSGLEVIPHLVVGIHFGRLLGEKRALEILHARKDRVRKLVVVCLMPLPGTPMGGTSLGFGPSEFGHLLAMARELLPEAELALGCARPRDGQAEEFELAALEAGVRRMALFSDRTRRRAEELGMEVVMEGTCCSR